MLEQLEKLAFWIGNNSKEFFAYVFKIAVSFATIWQTGRIFVKLIQNHFAKKYSRKFEDLQAHNDNQFSVFKAEMLAAFNAGIQSTADIFRKVLEEYMRADETKKQEIFEKYFGNKTIPVIKEVDVKLPITEEIIDELKAAEEPEEPEKVIEEPKEIKPKLKKSKNTNSDLL